MDFRFGAEAERFRSEVVRFLDREMAEVRAAGSADPTDLTGVDHGVERAMLRRAGAAGLLAASLPTALGGGGKPASFQAVANLEIAAHDAPLVDTAVTLTAGPILAFGSDEQRRTLIPAMAAGEIVTCIAYSEPGAGSDLSAITTAAWPDGDGYCLTGTKVLVTGAWKADWCCTIARTAPDVPIKEGASMFLVPMGSRGITVRRRRTMNGWTLGEIGFDAVRLDAQCLLGTLHAGWRQLGEALAAEGGGAFHVGFARAALERLVDHALRARRGGRPCAHDPAVRALLADLHVELRAAERLAKRAVWTVEQGEDATVAAAMAKVHATELLQRIARSATEVAGADALVLRPRFHSQGAGPQGRFGWEYLEQVHGSIGGGTNELKRSAIAMAALGLPRGR